jgi:hypothetical protein
MVGVRKINQDLNSYEEVMHNLVLEGIFFYFLIIIKFQIFYQKEVILIQMDALLVQLWVVYG